MRHRQRNGRYYHSTDSSNRQCYIHAHCSCQKGRPHAITSSAHQPEDPSDSKLKLRETHLDAADRGAIENLFSDSEASKGKGVSKRGHIRFGGGSTTAEKKRRLLRGQKTAAEETGQPSDEENVGSPPAKLRRLVKGVRPSQQSEQLEISSESTKQAGESFSCFD